MNPELIKTFCNVFNIAEDSEDCKNLISFYENSKRSITEQEFRFVCAAMRKACDDAKVRLSGAECSSDEFRELLSDFINRYMTAVSSRDLPVITSLAEYAANGKIKQDECGIFAELADKRTFPTPYNGSSEAFEVGELRLTLSYGKPVGGNYTGDICAILSPAPDQPTDEFIEKARCVCRDFAKSHPRVVIKAATDGGLLSDLSFLSDGYVIDTRLLPSPSENVQDIFSIKPPDVLLFPKREDLHDLWITSAIHGLTPTAPIASRAKFVTIRSGETSIEFTKDEISGFRKTKDICLGSCDTPELAGKTEVIISDLALTYSPYLLTAVKLGGKHIYESLKEITKDGDAVYAVCGILNEQDSTVLPLIITIDSFRRNCAPNVIYSRFFMGESTSVYVFKLTRKK